MASEPEPSDPPEAEGQRGFLENQQLELFAHIRRDVAQSERRDSVREANTARLLPQIRLAPEERLRALTPTRSGEYALIHAGRPSEGSKETIVPDWITADGYTRDLTVRSKVGDAQSSRRVGILTTATGAVSWIDLVPEDYEGEGSVRVGRGSGPPGSSVSGANWNDAGTKAFVFAVSFDDKDRWLWSVDAATGERTLVDHLHDDAWVAGPCFTECVGFVPGTDRIYFVSEETGYAHLYSVNADGSDRRALTSGEWEVLSVSMPEDRSRFFLRTNEGSPFSEHLFWMDFDGSHRERITEGEGRFNGTLSPDGKRLAIVHDVADRPLELFVADSDDAAEMSQVTDSPTEEWKSFPWIKPEILRFEAEDGTMVPARIYRPEDLGAEPHGERSSSCTERDTCTTFTTTGRRTTGSTSSTSSSRRAGTPYSTSTIAARPGTAPSGAPASTVGWEARTCPTRWMARATWRRTRVSMRNASGCTAAHTVASSRSWGSSQRGKPSSPARRSAP